MASPTWSASSVITPDSDADLSNSETSNNLLRKEQTGPVSADQLSNNEISTFRQLTSTYSPMIANDATSPTPSADIPQWKKDLIQRRKMNIAKTIASNQVIGASASDGPKANVNVLKTPASTQQQHDEMESLYGGQYTQVNNKSSGSSYNHNDKLAPRTASGALAKQEQQALVPATRSPIGMSEQISNNEGSSIATQENARFRKNLTEHQEATNTTSSDSLPPSTSRLSSGLKVAAAAEIYKKPNKDNTNACVGIEQQIHTLQEPALAPTANNNDAGSGNKSGNSSGSGGHSGPINNGIGVSDDEQQLNHQLKSGHESDSLTCVAAITTTGTTTVSGKETDLKAFSPNNSNSRKCLLNKKQCGIANAPVRIVSNPSPSASQAPSSSSVFLKNHSAGNTNLVSSHHNHKINNKFRINQNSTTLSTTSTLSSPSEVTNHSNKKKMVAVQEINEINTNNELDFDSSEELQYGPGIVSKLRCRYLSLALRQSMGKQLLSMDTMRRATSLNNLLDDNDVQEDDEEEDDTTNKEIIIPTTVSIPEEGIKQTTINSTDNDGGLKKHVKSSSGERIAATPLTYTNQHRSRHIKRGNDSLKRARSVEALLCEKSPWNFTNSQQVALNNVETLDAVTIEDKINNARDRHILGGDNAPKRLASIIDDTERPPPDLVKQTLKIFEASANRRGRPINRNSSGDVATKVANYKSIITQNKPPINFPKPPVSPKKSNLKKPTIELKKTFITSPTTTPVSIISPTAGISSVADSSSSAAAQHNPEMNILNSNLNSTPVASSRAIGNLRHKMDLTPIKNPVGCVGTNECLSENSPDIIPRHKLADKNLATIISVDSPVTEITKKIEKLRIESPMPAQLPQPLRKEVPSSFSADSSDRDSEDDSIDGEYIVNNEIDEDEDECTSAKYVPKSALDNIAKAGTSQHFQFQTKPPASTLANGNSLSKYPEPLHDIPTLSSSGATTVKQIGIIRPLLAEPNPQHIENSCPATAGGYIDENLPIPTTLTSREIEKNRINNEKKIEKSLNSGPMDEIGCVGFGRINKSIVAPSDSDGLAQVPAWSTAIINKKKRNPSGTVPENNTMVFNFKDRKEVPDYIENDGLIFKRKRELPKPNEPGFVLLGDLSLETSTDPDDDWPACPPSPCDVEFENANIIIDGKSSLKNRSKEVHFRVQFNDTLTSTFEYPSEASIIEEEGSDYQDLNSDQHDSKSHTSPRETNSPIIHHHVAVDEIIQLPPNNKALGNLSLGSAPLGSYTPLKANIENVFQLGITRVPNSQTNNSGDDIQSKDIIKAVDYGEIVDSSLEYLKPASDDLTIAYSEGSLKTDLLY